jgi:regulation of enolase protein 1 (concanavalin A-like superfamily)
MTSEYRWLNEPPAWKETDRVLEVTTGDKTDFWRKTHYSFVRDDGHFRYREVAGDFTATLAFSGDYQELYDQAGLMLRIDSETWIKAGIELVGGRQMLSAVVTRGHSDWSTMPLAEHAEWVQIRCTREASAVRLEWSDGKTPFSLFRLAFLPPSETLMVGPMCCSPQRAGLTARFRALEIGRATADALHD